MASRSAPGRLNVFQRAMLQWNDLHPYHAVDVLRFGGRPEVDRLRQVVARRLSLRGLASLRIHRSAGTFHYDGAPLPVEIHEVDAGTDPAGSLNTEIERQLGLRFDAAGRFLPFRFFVLVEESSFLLGTTYFHPVADGESVARLLRDVATDYVTGRSGEVRAALELHPRRHDRLLASRSPGVTARKVLALPSEIRAHKRSWRPPLRDPEDLSNRVRVTPWPADALARLTGTARAWGVTLHDLLLAMSLRALAPLATRRHDEPRRRNLTLGTIVNVRRDHGIDGGRVFGLFLGSFVVSHGVPEGIGLGPLAAEVQRQTSAVKRSRLYLATPLELRLASRLIAWSPIPERRTFFYRNYPIAGGITNMNLNELWPDDGTRPLDYLRAVSTGPVAPLVLAVVTFGGRMHCSLIWRPAVFTPEDVDLVSVGLSRQLAELEPGP